MNRNLQLPLYVLAVPVVTSANNLVLVYFSWGPSGPWYRGSELPHSLVLRLIGDLDDMGRTFTATYDGVARRLDHPDRKKIHKLYFWIAECTGGRGEFGISGCARPGGVYWRLSSLCSSGFEVQTGLKLLHPTVFKLGDRHLYPQKRKHWQ